MEAVSYLALPLASLLLSLHSSSTLLPDLDPIRSRSCIWLRAKLASLVLAVVFLSTYPSSSPPLLAWGLGSGLGRGSVTPTTLPPRSDNCYDSSNLSDLCLQPLGRGEGGPGRALAATDLTPNTDKPRPYAPTSTDRSETLTNSSSYLWVSISMTRHPLRNKCPTCATPTPSNTDKPRA